MPDIRFRAAAAGRRSIRSTRLLSFLYTLLTHDCRSAAEGVGLDPAVGFLHRDRPGRPSLALDLMEELRPVLADRLALSLFNRRQLRAPDFETRDGGAVLLSDGGRRTVLTAWQERKKEERRHPFLEESGAVWPCSSFAGAACWLDICAAIWTPIRPGSGSEARLASAQSDEGSP